MVTFDGQRGRKVKVTRRGLQRESSGARERAARCGHGPSAHVCLGYFAALVGGPAALLIHIIHITTRNMARAFAQGWMTPQRPLNTNSGRHGPTSRQTTLNQSAGCGNKALGRRDVTRTHQASPGRSSIRLEGVPQVSTNLFIS
jgi:hypothetical protein